MGTRWTRMTAAWPTSPAVEGLRKTEHRWKTTSACANPFWMMSVRNGHAVTATRLCTPLHGPIRRDAISLIPSFSVAKRETGKNMLGRLNPVMPTKFRQCIDATYASDVAPSKNDYQPICPGDWGGARSETPDTGVIEHERTGHTATHTHQLDANCAVASRTRSRTKQRRTRQSG